MYIRLHLSFTRIHLSTLIYTRLVTRLCFQIFQYMHLHLIILLPFGISGIESFKQNTSSRDAFLEPHLRENYKAAWIFMVWMLECAKPYTRLVTRLQLSRLL